MSTDTQKATSLVQVDSFVFRALGEPKGQPRPRAFSRGGKASVYDPGTAEGWKSCVAMACKDLANRKLAGALRVALTFYMPRPKSHFKANGQLKPTAPVFVHTKKPDIDNLEKAVLDAMTQIGVWGDDDQVFDLRGRRYFESAPNAGGQSFPCGCVIRVCVIEEREVGE